MESPSSIESPKNLKLKMLKNEIQTILNDANIVRDIIHISSNGTSNVHLSLDIAELTNISIELEYAEFVRSIAEIYDTQGIFDIIVYKVERAINRSKEMVNILHKDYSKFLTH